MVSSPLPNKGVVNQVHLLEKGKLGLVVPGTDAGGPLEEKVFQEMGDPGESRFLVHAPDPVLDHEGYRGGSGTGENEKAEPILQGVLVELGEGKRKLLCTHPGGEAKKNEKKKSSQRISG